MANDDKCMDFIIPSRLQRRSSTLRERTMEGISLLAVSAFLFSLMGLCLQFTGRMGIPSTELVFIRAVFQGFFVVIGMVFFRVEDPPATDALSHRENKGKYFNKKNDFDAEDGSCLEEKKTDSDSDFYANENTSLLPSKSKHASKIGYGKLSNLPPRIITRPFGNTTEICKIIIFRGFIGGLGYLNFFYTLSTLPLGDATTLLSLYPVITIFLARCVLGEPIKTVQLIASVLSVIGACLICQPSFLVGKSEEVESGRIASQTQYPTFGYVTALLGSVCASCVIVLIRKAGNVGAHTLQLLFSWVVFGIIFSLIAEVMMGRHSSNSKWFIPSRNELLPIIGVCITGSGSHFLLNYAAKLAPASIGGLVRSTDIGWSYLWQVMILGITPQTGTYWGVCCVCFSLILVVLAGSNDDNRKLVLEKQHSSNDDEITMADIIIPTSHSDDNKSSNYNQ
ncbi:hypothetical protein ACHAXS_001190 [Conticribra weissflogii]